MTNKTHCVPEYYLHLTTWQVWRWREQELSRIWLHLCVCLRESETGQFEASHVGNDREPFHPSWLSPHLWEGNLDGRYRNESEERPTLRAITIEPKSAEKWQMWFRSDLSLQVFRVLTAQQPLLDPTPSPADTDRLASVAISLTPGTYDGLSACPSHCITISPLYYFEPYWINGSVLNYLEQEHVLLTVQKVLFSP